MGRHRDWDTLVLLICDDAVSFQVNRDTWTLKSALYWVSPLRHLVHTVHRLAMTLQYFRQGFFVCPASKPNLEPSACKVGALPHSCRPPPYRSREAFWTRVWRTLSHECRIAELSPILADIIQSWEAHINDNTGRKATSMHTPAPPPQ